MTIRKDNITLELVRYMTAPAKGGTPGELILRQGEDILHECATVELDWLDNQRDVSCVPEGLYELVARPEGRFYKKARDKWGHDCCLWVRGVEGRSYILIHWGNFIAPPEPSSQGCILVGQRPGIHKGYRCVWQSQKAFRLLYKAVRPFLTTAHFGEETPIPFIIRDASKGEDEKDLTRDRSDI